MSTKPNKKSRKPDIRLSDFVLFWMIELLPILFSRPFQYSQTLCRRDQANSLLRGRINSKSTHKLACDVEDAVELNDEHVKIGKTTLESMVRSEVVRQRNHESL